jgi:flagellar biosynthesis protein FlhG
MQPVADQAAGLRRLLAAGQVRTVCIAGAMPRVGRSTIASNLALALSRQGGDVLALDCCDGTRQLADLLGVPQARELLDVIQQDSPGVGAVQARAGLRLLRAGGTLRRLRQATDDIGPWLGGVLDSVREGAEAVVIDSPANALAPAAAASDLVLVTTPDPQSVTHSYRMVKRLVTENGRRRMFVLVNRAPSTSHADRIFGNLSRTAGEFLGVTVQYLGFVPDDERIGRAAALCRPVLDAFPRSAAAQALRECARNVHGWPASGENTLAPFAQRLVNAARLTAHYA